MIDQSCESRTLGCASRQPVHPLRDLTIMFADVGLADDFRKESPTTAVHDRGQFTNGSRRFSAVVSASSFQPSQQPRIGREVNGNKRQMKSQTQEVVLVMMMMTRSHRLDFLAVVTALSRHDKGCYQRDSVRDKREFYFLANNSSIKKIYVAPKFIYFKLKLIFFKNTFSCNQM